VLEQALQRSKEENGQRGLPSDGKPEPLIEEEFRKDPEVAVLIREITEVENHLERAKGKARQPNDPAVIAADKHLSKWMLRYEKLWKIQYEKIRQRLWDVFGPVADEKLEPLIEDEFRRDPEVADVIREVTEARDQLEHTKGMAKQPNDPAVIAIHKQHAKLMDRYENLWKIKYKEILQRLRDVSGPTPSSINELRLKVAAMKNKKERQTKNFEKMQPQFKNKE